MRTWAEFKQMTVRDLLAFGDALSLASSVENGDAQSGVLYEGRPVEDVATDVFFDFLDNGLLKFRQGSIAETTSDAGLAVVRGSVEVVDKMLGLVRMAAPILDAKPLAGLPF